MGDFSAAYEAQTIEGGNAWSETYTFAGLNVGSSTTWVSEIRRNPKDVSPLVTATIATSTAANTVTVSASTSAIGALVPSGVDSFVGWWGLRNKTLKRTYIKGPFTVLEPGVH